MNALVLSGGGSKGAWQAGVIHELIRQGVEYDLICGVSVGAINGGFLAQSPPEQMKDNIDFLVDMWESINTSNVYRKWFLWPLSVLWKPSVYNVKPLRDMIDKHIDNERLMHSRTFFSCGAVSHETGQIKYFLNRLNKDMKTAIMASAAFPAFLTPQEIGGDHYYDGGARDVTPIKKAIDMGAKAIDIVGNFTIDITPRYDKKITTLKVATRTLEMMSNEIIKNDLKALSLYNDLAAKGLTNKRYIPYRIFTPSVPLDINPLEFEPETISKYIKLGKKDAKNYGK